MKKLASLVLLTTIACGGSDVQEEVPGETGGQDDCGCETGSGGGVDVGGGGGTDSGGSNDTGGTDGGTVGGSEGGDSGGNGAGSGSDTDGDGEGSGQDVGGEEGGSGNIPGTGQCFAFDIRDGSCPENVGQCVSSCVYVCHVLRGEVACGERCSDICKEHFCHEKHL